MSNIWMLLLLVACDLQLPHGSLPEGCLSEVITAATAVSEGTLGGEAVRAAGVGALAAVHDVLAHDVGLTKDGLGRAGLVYPALQ
jgi:hypothetical protein